MKWKLWKLPLIYNIYSIEVPTKYCHSYHHNNCHTKYIFFGWEGNLAYLLKEDHSNQIQENNRMGKTRDLFKKIRDSKGTFHSTTVKSPQSCLTLCDPIDGSPPGCPIPGILQARTLEWVAIAFSNAWKWKAKVKSLSHVQLSGPMDCSLPGSSVHGI